VNQIGENGGDIPVGRVKQTREGEGGDDGDTPGNRSIMGEDIPLQSLPLKIRDSCAGP